MTPTQVLIIDDEADVCSFLRRLLTRKGHAVTTATCEADALTALSSARFNVAMVDLKLPDTDGLTLLQLIKARQPACEVIIMTGYSTVKTAVTAMQQGAYEYIEKPFDDIDEIEALIARAATHGSLLTQRETSREEWADVADAIGFQVGTSPLMRRMVSLAHKVAGKNINVLIQGKTGTGKELLARFIHAASNRADAPFIPVNCGALPENLLESELFGHERGSFTGASHTRKGIFELANRGTLLLDEIGDASPMIQVKLLRVLETGEFMRVGGERPIRTDVRVIAATNVDLEEAIREKTFREDLFYRLNVVRLEIPPLHLRGEDIPLLAEHFCRMFNPKAQITPATLQLLQNYGWPGNIRELANVMRRAVVMSPDGTILPGHLNDRFQALTPALSSTGRSPGATEFLATCERFLQQLTDGEDLGGGLGIDGIERLLAALLGIETMARTALPGQQKPADEPRRLMDTEADAIRSALAKHHWNISEAARALGIGRNTLYRKIKQFKLQR